MYKTETTSNSYEEWQKIFYKLADEINTLYKLMPINCSNALSIFLERSLSNSNCSASVFFISLVIYNSPCFFIVVQGTFLVRSRVIFAI